MKTTPANGSEDSKRPALLPFDPADMMAMRVRPAEFARMCDVSRQTVSQWVKKGLIALGPDGLLEPTKAARSVVTHSHPARLRARTFKLASASYEELRTRIATLEAELVEHRGPMRAQIEIATRNEMRDTQAAQIVDFCNRLDCEFDALAQARAPDAAELFEELLDAIVEAAFYPPAIAGADAGQDRVPAPDDLLTGIASHGALVVAAEVSGNSLPP